LNSMATRRVELNKSVCVIQHLALEVYALLKIHLDAFDHEVSYRHALTALSLGNRGLPEPQRPCVQYWPNVGWDL
jgi:hypothetical protein